MCRLQDALQRSRSIHRHHFNIQIVYEHHISSQFSRKSWPLEVTCILGHREEIKRGNAHKLNTKILWEVSGFSLSRDSSSYIMNSSRIVIAQCHRRCWLVAWGSCWHICPAVHLLLPNCTWILYSADGSIPGPSMEKLQCCGHKMTFMIPMEHMLHIIGHVGH